MDSDLLWTTEAGYFSLTQAVVISDVTRIFSGEEKTVQYMQGYVNT